MLIKSYCSSLGWPSEEESFASPSQVPFTSGKHLESRDHQSEASTKPDPASHGVQKRKGPRGPAGGVVSAEGWHQGLLLVGDMRMVLKKPLCAAGKLGLAPSHKPQRRHSITHTVWS